MHLGLLNAKKWLRVNISNENGILHAAKPFCERKSLGETEIK